MRSWLALVAASLLIARAVYAQDSLKTEVDRLDWGEKTKFELGFSVGYPEIVAGTVGARNLFGTGFLVKLYWGAFAQAGEIEIGWSWKRFGKWKPYVSAFYGGGNWLFVAIAAPVAIGFEGQVVGVRYGLVLNDLFVFSLGAGYGTSKTDNSFVVVPSRGRTGLVLSATAGVSLFL